MSYCRFAEGCNVYVYEDVSGGYTCCSCALNPHSLNLATPAEMAAHMRAHRDAGHIVPQFVIDDLEAHQHCVDQGIGDECLEHG